MNTFRALNTCPLDEEALFLSEPFSIANRSSLRCQMRQKKNVSRGGGRGDIKPKKRSVAPCGQVNRGLHQVLNFFSSSLVKVHNNVAKTRFKTRKKKKKGQNIQGCSHYCFNPCRNLYTTTYEKERYRSRKNVASNVSR